MPDGRQETATLGRSRPRGSCRSYRPGRKERGGAVLRGSDVVDLARGEALIGSDADLLMPTFRFWPFGNFGTFGT